MREDFLTLYLDPGEDFGWCLGCGTTLVSAGTEKMWFVADEIHNDLYGNPSPYLRDENLLRDGVDPMLLSLPIKRVVCEDWRLYPEKLKFLKWDKCRTARVIGDVTGSCRRTGTELIFQPASIKQAAQAAGAEELYYRPLHENRHQNDAIQHFTFFVHTVLITEMDPQERYAILGIPNNAQEGGDEK
jgi:hypothetical protein